MNDRRTSRDVATQGPPDYEQWRSMLEEGVILGTICEDCGQTTATPKRRCIQCGSERLGPVELPTTGRVYSETTIFVTPDGFEDSYQIAMIDLDETVLTVRVDGTVEIDDRVQFAGTIASDGRPAPVFEPLE